MILQVCFILFAIPLAMKMKLNYCKITNIKFSEKKNAKRCYEQLVQIDVTEYIFSFKTFVNYNFKILFAYHTVKISIQHQRKNGASVLSTNLILTHHQPIEEISVVTSGVILHLFLETYAYTLVIL